MHFCLLRDVFSQEIECFFSIECFVTLLNVMDVIVIKWKIVQKWMEISVCLSFLPFYWWILKWISHVTFDQLAVRYCFILTYVMLVFLHGTDVVFIVKVHVRIVLFY
jgi:hypothetical protein